MTEKGFWRENSNVTHLYNFFLLCNILITSEALRQCSFTFYLRASWEREGNAETAFFFVHFTVPQNMEFKPSFIVQPKKTSVNKVDFITQTVQFNWPVKMAPIWMMLTGCGNWVNAWLDSLHDLKIISNENVPHFSSATQSYLFV